MQCLAPALAAGRRLPAPPATPPPTSPCASAGRRAGRRPWAGAARRDQVGRLPRAFRTRALPPFPCARLLRGVVRVTASVFSAQVEKVVGVDTFVMIGDNKVYMFKLEPHDEPGARTPLDAACLPLAWLLISSCRLAQVCSPPPAQACARGSLPSASSGDTGAARGAVRGWEGLGRAEGWGWQGALATSCTRELPRLHTPH